MALAVGQARCEGRLQYGGGGMRHRQAIAAISVALLGTTLPHSGAGAAQASSTPPAAATDNDLPSMVAKASEHLKLNPQQQAAFLAFEAGLVDKIEEPPADPDAFRAMSLPEKYDFVADHATVSLAKIRAESQAAHRLYDLLTPDQRKQLDAMMSSPEGSVAPQSTELPASVLALRQPGRTEPDWLVKPSQDEISRLYPKGALKRHVTGATTVHCTVDIDGYLSDCTVTKEEPKDAGFGNAALQATSYMRMKPATLNGAPIEADVSVPLNFNF